MHHNITYINKLELIPESYYKFANCNTGRWLHMHDFKSADNNVILPLQYM